MSSQRYYIAVPNNVKWGYQTIPTWKNYSFTGTLFDAQKKALELFIEEGHLNEDMVDNLDLIIDDSDTINKLYESWEDLSIEVKDKYIKDFCNEYFQFEIDDFNKGLALWDEVSNDDKKNVYADKLNVIELD